MSSNVWLEEVTRHCSLELSIREIGIHEFTQAFLKIQLAEAAEELGDVVIEGKEIVEQAQIDSGTKRVLDPVQAEAAALNIIGCLQRRYKGECAIMACIGKDYTDRLIANLSNDEK